MRDDRCPDYVGVGGSSWGQCGLSAEVAQATWRRGVRDAQEPGGCRLAEESLCIY